MHTMSWQFLNVVEGFAACNVQVFEAECSPSHSSAPCGVFTVTALASHVSQVAQYPPLRVGRHPETWAFTLENEYVSP
jgi:hypothetical protein